MIKIEGDFISLTAKVRTNGSSFIVGLSKSDCEYGGIEKGSMIQIFLRKMDSINKVDVSANDELDEEEIDFVEKYKSNPSPILIQKAVDQFGKEKVKELIHRFVKKK